MPQFTPFALLAFNRKKKDGHARFLKIYEEYKKAPDVTRRRMYLETMERLFGGIHKIILDSGAGSGVVPDAATEPEAGGSAKPGPDSADGRQPMRLNVAGGKSRDH